MKKLSEYCMINSNIFCVLIHIHRYVFIFVRSITFKFNYGLPSRKY